MENCLDSYFTSPNYHLIGFIDKQPEDEFSVLEIGCAGGATLQRIKKKFPNSKVYGVDINYAAIENAKQYCKAWCLDIEKDPLPPECEKSFDYIIFGDVLEHLHNPAAALKYTSLFLKEDGKFLISVPNIQHISVLSKLINGYFTYEDWGLLDRTHIHFFTYYELLRMFNDVGLEVVRKSYTDFNIYDDDEEIIKELMKITTFSQEFMFRAYQFLFILKKRNFIRES